MEDDKDTEKATKIENGSFLKANIFTITIPQASFTTSFLFLSSLFLIIIWTHIFHLFVLYAVLSRQIDGGTNISVKLKWSQKLLYHDGEFTLNIPFNFPEYVTPAAKKVSKQEKIQLNVNAGPGTEIMCKSSSHPLKVSLLFLTFITD